MTTPRYQGIYNKLFPKKMSTNSFLTIYILHTLNKTGAWMYGKEIIDKIEDRFNGTFKPSHGLCYPLLRELEEAGLVEARWEGDDPTKKTRRLYRITEAGRQALDKEVANFYPLICDTYNFIGQVMQDLYSVKKKKGNIQFVEVI